MPKAIQKAKNWFQEWCWKHLGKPYWQSTESELNHPCFTKVCAWCKEQTDAGREDVGWIWYYRDLGHWEEHVHRKERYHAVGIKKVDGKIEYWECSYPPLGETELSPEEFKSITQWSGPRAD